MRLALLAGALAASAADAHAAAELQAPAPAAAWEAECRLPGAEGRLRFFSASGDAYQDDMRVAWRTGPSEIVLPIREGLYHPDRLGKTNPESLCDRVAAYRVDNAVVFVLAFDRRPSFAKATVVLFDARNGKVLDLRDAVADIPEPDGAGRLLVRRAGRRLLVRLLQDDAERWMTVDVAGGRLVLGWELGNDPRSAPWAGAVPDGDPAALVTAFIQADAWGLQTGSHWPLVQTFTTWPDGPGWDFAMVVESAEIVSHRTHGAREEVVVLVKVLGRLASDGETMPVFDASRAGVTTRTFVLENVGAGAASGPRWKIVAPQDGPHVSVGYALGVRLPQWCGPRDCTGTAAFKALQRAQSSCAPSKIPLNRTCDQRLRPIEP